MAKCSMKMMMGQTRTSRPDASQISTAEVARRTPIVVQTRGKVMGGGVQLGRRRSLFAAASPCT